jgi:hypothetical protein
VWKLLFRWNVIEYGRGYCRFDMFLDCPGGISILMFSLSRPVLLLVLIASASLTLQALPMQAPDAQTPSSPSSSSSSQAAPQAQTPSPNAASLSVAARIRARREQRRATAIHDIYSHLYELYIGTGFTRTIPGPGVAAGAGLQHFNLYDWNVGVTRYFNQRLGVTVDGRGAYGTSYIGNNPFNQHNPGISQYSGMIGPTYRFYIQPKYSISGRVLAGVVYGNFSADTNGFGTKLLGLYPDGTEGMVSASVPFEYNLNTSLGLRVAPEYRLTTFGGTINNGWGATGGIVYRWGKQ